VDEGLSKGNVVVYCNGFAQRVSGQRLGKHGQRATIRDVSQ
jgi:hypothetical protein